MEVSTDESLLFEKCTIRIRMGYNRFGDFRNIFIKDQGLRGEVIL